MSTDLQKPSHGARLQVRFSNWRAGQRELFDVYRLVYARDRYRCVACGNQVSPTAKNKFKRAHPHHIVLRSQASKAEKHTTANICTLCPFCHADVHDKTLSITGNADERLSIRRIA